MNITFSAQRRIPMMYHAVGPFCSSCGCHLWVQPCTRCSTHGQEISQEVQDSIFSALESDTSAFLQVTVSVSTSLCYLLLPMEMFALTYSLQRQFPGGILVFHKTRKQWCLFQVPFMPRHVGAWEAIDLLLLQLCLGFALVPGGMLQITVTPDS